MPTDSKKKIVEDLTSRLQRLTCGVVIDYRGLSMVKQSALRGKIKDQQMDYQVVKNTLLKIALHDAGINIGETDLFEGPTAVILSYDDIVAPAKVAMQARKEFDKVAVKGGFLPDALLSVEQVEKLSKVPPKEQLYAQLLGRIQAPLSGLVGVLQGTIRGLVTTLDAYRSKKAA
jgi:large subunit ribosomal protein L10